MITAFRTELDLNNKQKSLMIQHCGCARYAWNWGLALTKEILNHNNLNSNSKIKFPSSIDLHKRFVAEVKSQNDWLYNSSKWAPQEALRDLDIAWTRCFKKISKPPKFKKKGNKDGFYLEGLIKIESKRIKLPKIGWVRTFESLSSQVVKNVRITSKAGRWFISFKLEESIPQLDLSSLPVVGVDLGIKILATLSTGITFKSPKAYKSNNNKLKRLQRKLCRQTKGSSNRQKTKLKLAKQHKRIADIRLDNLHKLTSYLAKNHSHIVIEDLNVSGMMKNHKLARAIADMGFYEFRRQLTYKCNWYGSKLTIVDRFFPSSKLCSNCGSKQNMPLGIREYKCPKCNVNIDRDLNASINLSKAVSSTVTVCGETKVHGASQVSLIEAGIEHIIINNHKLLRSELDNH